MMPEPPQPKMPTVGKLIEYLKTQDPDANILAYEPNSQAYIDQDPDLPNMCIRKEGGAK